MRLEDDVYGGVREHLRAVGRTPAQIPADEPVVVDAVGARLARGDELSAVTYEAEPSQPGARPVAVAPDDPPLGIAALCA